MDITKVYSILKKSLHIRLSHDTNGGQWLGNSSASYNVDGLPELDCECVLPLIGVDIDVKAKYTVMEDTERITDMILKHECEGDGMVELTDLNIRGVAVMRGVGRNAPACVFINANYLKPFMADDEITYIVRKTPNEAGYVLLVKRGLITLGVIAPVHYKDTSAVTDQLIADLTNIISAIKEQQSDEDDGQLSIE